jgi:DNA-binding NarL/FixJ family response regulator
VPPELWRQGALGGVEVIAQRHHLAPHGVQGVTRSLVDVLQFVDAAFQGLDAGGGGADLVAHIAAQLAQLGVQGLGQFAELVLGLLHGRAGEPQRGESHAHREYTDDCRHAAVIPSRFDATGSHYIFHRIGWEIKPCRYPLAIPGELVTIRTGIEDHPRGISVPAIEESRKIRVAVVDKNPLVQAGLKQILGEDGRFEVVFICADADTFIDALDETPPERQPDVAVIGWVLSDSNGKYILDQLMGREVAPRVVVYTGAEGEAIAQQVMAHGGAGYVSKSERPEHLVATVGEVAAGRMVFPYLDVRQIYDNPLTSLTRRELEVLSALAAGRTNKQIAIDQEISPNTVKFHIKNLYSKLGVANRAQAVALYLKS